MSSSELKELIEMKKQEEFLANKKNEEALAKKNHAEELKHKHAEVKIKTEATDEAFTGSKVRVNEPTAPFEVPDSEGETPEAVIKGRVQKLVAFIGVSRFTALPDNYEGVPIRAFKFSTGVPISNPHKTIWAIIHATKGASLKCFKSIYEGFPGREPRELKTNMKVVGGVEIPYTINLMGSQNSDVMLRQLYGDVREGNDKCEKCSKGGVGIFTECVVHPDGEGGCANCDWGHSAGNCSFVIARSASKKRKAVKVEESSSDEELDSDENPFISLSHKTLTKVAKALKVQAKINKGK
ncbi:hypothetical protein ACHAPU_002504 [Fusarium lateritium]